MKKSIAVLSALLIGLSYCSPGSVSRAADDTNVTMDDQNKEATKATSMDDEKSPVNQVTSADDRDSFADETPSADAESSVIKHFWKKITGTGGKEDSEKKIESEMPQSEIERHKTVSTASDINNLQIPQKMDVVIDPWQMDGKGQVYSELYVIRNTGDTSGILTFSNLTCRPREQSGVIVKADKEGLHDSGDKYIYMEMLFGNGNRIIFTSEKSQYQTELKPGEELSVCFSGEVNENAFGQWMNQDVAISVIYSWETEEALDGLNLDGMEEQQTRNQDENGLNEQQKNNANEKELTDRQQTDTSVEEPSDCQQTDMSTEDEQNTVDSGKEIQDDNPQEAGTSDTLQGDVNEESKKGAGPDNANTDTQQDALSNINAENKKESEIDFGMESDQPIGNTDGAVESLKTDEETMISEEKEKEEIKKIDLQEPQKVDVNIDSWKIDERGRIVSQQYLLYNAGDTAGIWTLSDIICKPKETGKIRIMTDKKGLCDGEDKSVYMELVLGNGEKLVLSQESSTYEVKLEPEEKLAVRFIGEMNGNLFENREDGDIAVTAVCSWERN